MAEVLRDSSYEACVAVNNPVNGSHPDYLELSDSTYEKLPENYYDSSHHEYTTPSDVQDCSTRKSLEYEKPIQFVLPLSQLQPPKQQNNYVPELPKNRPQSPHNETLQHKPNGRQDYTHINATETKLPSKKQQHSKRSKRPCIIGVVLFLIILIGSGIATFMVFHYKKQDKSNPDRQQQDLGQGNKSVTSVTATTFKQFTVIPTTRARTSQTSSTLVQDVFKDCKELKINGYINDGVYFIYPYLPIATSVRVYCDMTTDGGGWTVFQHRKDGSVDFYLFWDNYKKGFGEANGEYWLGNDHLHRLTSLGTSDFYVRLEKFTGGWAYAKYNNFSVADESDGYRMRLKVGSYQGNAGDSVESEGTTNTNGFKFSTSDIDNDVASASCAVARKGAWWYNECTWANLNGIYGNGSCAVAGNCNFWYSLTNSFSGVKTSFMMVRRA